MVRLVPCGVRECRQQQIDRRGTDRDVTNKRRRKNNSITEYVLQCLDVLRVLLVDLEVQL